MADPYQQFFDSAFGPEKAMWAIAIAVRELTAQLGTVERITADSLNGNTPLLRRVQDIRAGTG